MHTKSWLTFAGRLVTAYVHHARPAKPSDTVCNNKKKKRKVKEAFDNAPSHHRKKKNKTNRIRAASRGRAPAAFVPRKSGIHMRGSYGTYHERKESKPPLGPLCSPQSARFTGLISQISVLSASENRKMHAAPRSLRWSTAHLDVVLASSNPGTTLPHR